MIKIKIDKNKLNKNINILEELINKYKENNTYKHNKKQKACSTSFVIS